MSRKSVLQQGPPPMAPPPPKPTAQPPTDFQAQEQLMQQTQMLREKFYMMEDKYHRCKSEIENYKQRNDYLTSQLEAYMNKTRSIDDNYHNLQEFPKTISDLTEQCQILQEKNSLLSQTKNALSDELSHAKCDNSEMLLKISNEQTKMKNLESEYNNMRNNYEETIVKSNKKYTALKDEFNQLDEEHKDVTNKLNITSQEYNVLTIQNNELRDEHMLLKESYHKLKTYSDELQISYNSLQTQHKINQQDNEKAVELSQKKNLQLIQDLKKALKTEITNAQQSRAELMQTKDELNDLREWRQNYLLHNTTQSNKKNSDTVVSNSSSDDGNNYNEEKSSASQKKNSGKKLSPTPPSRRGSIASLWTNVVPNDNYEPSSIKNGSVLVSPTTFATTTTKQVFPKALPPSTPHASNKSVNFDEGSDVVIVGNGDDSEHMEGTPANNINNDTKEHDEVISALSNRLATVKENNMYMKQQINKLNVDLSKKEEMIRDLIEKLNEFTPIPLVEKTKTNVNNNHDTINEEQSKVFSNLEKSGLSQYINDETVNHNMNRNNNNGTYQHHEPPSQRPPPIPLIPSLHNINSNQEIENVIKENKLNQQLQFHKYDINTVMNEKFSIENHDETAQSKSFIHVARDTNNKDNQ